MPKHPDDGTPLTHPYDRGYWSPETGETVHDVPPGQRREYREGLARRMSEEDRELAREGGESDA